MKNIFKILFFLSRKTKTKLYYFILILVSASIIDAVSVTALSPFLEILTTKNNSYEIPEIYKFIINNSFLINFDILLSSLIIFIVLIIFSSLIRLYNLYLSMNISKIISIEISTKIFNKNVNQRYEEYISRNSHEFINLGTRQIDRFTESLGGLFNIFVAITISVAIITALTILNPLITWSLITTITLGYLAITKFTSSKFKINDKLISKHGKIQIRLLQEASFGFIEILLGANQEKAVTNFKKNENLLKTKLVENQFLSLSPKYLLEPILIVTGITIIFLLITKEVTNANKIISSIGVVALGGQKILPVFSQIYGGLSSIKSNDSAVKAILSVLIKRGGEIKDKNFKQYKNNNPTESKDFKSMILTNISFRFRDQKYLINNINLEFHKGEKIGIVGTTGSGKSSLINIMMGLLKPTSGELFFNGELIYPSEDEDIKIQYLQSKLSYVPQDIFLKDGSIAENIAFGDESYKYKLKEIKEIALIAQLGELLKKSRDGLNTQVGDRGINLSGGQKQRIGVARAIYKKCDLLFLDEATSALDNETESKLLSDILKNFPKITIVSIAHRIQSIKDFDKIYVIRKGKIENFGNYSQLVEKSNYFKKLIQYEQKI